MKKKKEMNLFLMLVKGGGVNNDNHPIDILVYYWNGSLENDPKSNDGIIGYFVGDYIFIIN